MRPGQPDSANGLVMVQRVGSGIGGAEDLDIELLKEAAWLEFGLGQFSGNLIVNLLEPTRQLIYLQCQRHHEVHG